MAKRLVLKTAVCPGCAAVGSIRKILYGMPDPETFDFEKYAVGGCCLNGDGTDPDFACKLCDWAGMREEILAIK